MKYFILIVIVFVSLIVLSIKVSLGEDEHGYEHDRYTLFEKQPGVAPVKNHLYEQECSSCHFAYPPGLLPAQSWQAIMTGLGDHFGENAELAEPDRSAIQTYLLANSADTSELRRSRKIMRSVSASAVPLRITELRYFKHEHDEIPARLVTGNPDVGSFSQCDRCHQDAKYGFFSENKITIPGYGRWDD
jgi:hypothetical protein